MLRQHFQEVLNCLDNREILEVFTKVKHVDRPIVRRIVTKTLVKPSERSPPLPSTDSNSSRGQAKLSSPTASMQSKKSGQKNMQKVSNTGGDQQRKPANTSSSGMLRVPSTGRPSSKQTMKTAVARDDLETCKYCSRRFATDRLQVHEDICARTGKKKRKTYDATKHRLQGTELEPYTRRTQKSASKAKSLTGSTAASSSSSSSLNSRKGDRGCPPKNSRRRKPAGMKIKPKTKAPCRGSTDGSNCRLRTANDNNRNCYSNNDKEIDSNERPSTAKSGSKNANSRRLEAAVPLGKSRSRLQSVRISSSIGEQTTNSKFQPPKRPLTNQQQNQLQLSNNKPQLKTQSAVNVKRNTAGKGNGTNDGKDKNSAPPPPFENVAEQLFRCRFCNRKFARDRLQVHEKICSKSGKSKREKYDASKHRMKGTEMESFTGRSKDQVIVSGPILRASF